jgi:hypothetical protein
VGGASYSMPVRKGRCDLRCPGGLMVVVTGVVPAWPPEVGEMATN